MTPTSSSAAMAIGIGKVAACRTANLRPFVPPPTRTLLGGYVHYFLMGKKMLVSLIMEGNSLCLVSTFSQSNGKRIS